jgi:hypothetical protein
MQKLFTHNDIIRFAYNEMNSEEALEFKTELKDHPELELELDHILASQDALDKLTEAPNPGIVKSLLAYSASLKIHKISSRGITLDIVNN